MSEIRVGGRNIARRTRLDKLGFEVCESDFAVLHRNFENSRPISGTFENWAKKIDLISRRTTLENLGLEVGSPIFAVLERKFEI